MIKQGLHWADVLFLLIVLGVFATVVRAPIYIEFPLVLVSAFAWKHIREWLGVGNIVSADARRRGHENVAPRR